MNTTSSASHKLTQGSIWQALMRLALPIMASSLIQMAYSFTDLFWVSGLGSPAIAAVGTGGLFIWFADSLVYLARMGGQVLSAQSLGAEDLTQARRYAGSSLQLGMLLGLLYGLLMLCFHPQLIAFFHFKSHLTIQMSESYLLITGSLIIFPFMARIFTGLMTATGDSRTPFIITTLGLVINMLLDPLFILVFSWGIQGAAWATVLSQSIVLLLFFYAAQQNELLCRLPLFRYYRSCYLSISRIGIPAGLQTMFYAGTSIAISRLIANYGDLAVAAQRIGSQIESLSWLTAEGLAAALNAFVAQNVGAKAWHRAKKAYHLAATFMCGLSLLVSLCFLCFPQLILQPFLHEAASLDIGIHYLKILAFSQTLMSLELVANGTFAGYGKTLYPSLVCIFLTAARLPLSLLLTQSSLGLHGIWWAISISSICKGGVLTLSLPFFRRRYEERHQSPLIKS